MKQDTTKEQQTTGVAGRKGQMSLIEAKPGMCVDQVGQLGHGGGGSRGQTGAGVTLLL